MGNVSEKVAAIVEHQKQVYHQRYSQRSTVLPSLVLQYIQLRTKGTIPVEVSRRLQPFDEILGQAQRYLALSEGVINIEEEEYSKFVRSLSIGLKFLRRYWEEQEACAMFQEEDTGSGDEFVLISRLTLNPTAMSRSPPKHSSSPRVVAVADMYQSLRGPMVESIQSLHDVFSPQQVSALDQMQAAFDAALKSVRSGTPPPATNISEPSTSTSTPPPPPSVQPAEIVPAYMLPPPVPARAARPRPSMQVSDRVSQAHEVLQLAVAVAEKWGDVVPWLLDNPDRVTQLGNVKNLDEFQLFCAGVQAHIERNRERYDELLDSNCCTICFECYNETNRRPVIPMPANCIHVLCRFCAEDMMKWHYKECPVCALPFQNFRFVTPPALPSRT